MTGRDGTVIRRPDTTYQTRDLIIRIYFDDADVPNVEAPIGDLFGIMHGLDYYDINTEVISVKRYNGYECYFQMPFSGSARIEITNGPDGENRVYVQVEWNRYPGQEMIERRRFCAQWRREMPTQRYGKYTILKASGNGELVGFFYGVRLLDDTDRWSHGGAENIYIDGLGEHPAYLRGLGGEDTFGTSYGGVMHPAETHLRSGMPYYVAEDIGTAKTAARVVGYRFYWNAPIKFRESLLFKFGCMANDICSIAYWYQEKTPKRYAKIPEWSQLKPGTELIAADIDVLSSGSGSWKVGSVLENENGEGIRSAFGTDYRRNEESAKWRRVDADGGFVDFEDVHKSMLRASGDNTIGKAAVAVSYLEVPRDMDVMVRIAWDDQLVLRVNDANAIDFGTQGHFRQRGVTIPLKKGINRVTVTQSNEAGYNNGGWVFAFMATGDDGTVIVPDSDLGG